MTATIKGKILVIEIPLETPTPSKTGKTLVVASSHGNQKTSAKLTEGPHKGEEVTVGLNVYIRNPNPPQA